MDQDEDTKTNTFDLVYTSNYNSTVYGVKMLSFTGCITSLIVAPIIIFNPLNFPVLASISMVGKCFLGGSCAVFGVGTSYCLHLFTKSIATKIYHNAKTDDIQLQFVTIYLSTITLQTNLNHMKALNKSTHIGIANVECTDIGRKCFINDELLSDYISEKMGFDEDVTDRSNTNDDTSWMGKQ